MSAVQQHIAHSEGFYASVFYSSFAALGYEIAVEESSSHARLDMAVRTGGNVYLCGRITAPAPWTYTAFIL